MIEIVFGILQALLTHLWIDFSVTGSLLEADGLRVAVSCTDRALSYCLTWDDVERHWRDKAQSELSEKPAAGQEALPRAARNLPSWDEEFSLFLLKWYPFAFIAVQWLSKPCIIAGSMPQVLTGLSLIFHNKPTRTLLESCPTEEAMEAQSQEFKHSQEHWASLSRLHGVLPSPSWFSHHEVLLCNQTEGPSFTLLFP